MATFVRETRGAPWISSEWNNVNFWATDARRSLGRWGRIALKRSRVRTCRWSGSWSNIHGILQKLREIVGGKGTLGKDSWWTIRHPLVLVLNICLFEHRSQYLVGNNVKLIPSHPVSRPIKRLWFKRIMLRRQCWRSYRPIGFVLTQPYQKPEVIILCKRHIN